VLFIAFGIVTVVGVVMGGGCFLLGKYLLRFYTDTPETIAYGLVRLRYICLLYVCCGWMEVLVGQMRGMGYSFVPMIVSFIGVCGFRIFWIFTVFRQSHTLPTLYISYPISWAITIFIYVVILLVLWNKVIKKKMISPPEKEELSAENA
jgi:Na+-driven multidrug efflux pump